MKANALIAGAAITAAVLVAARSDTRRAVQNGTWIVSQDAEQENPVLGVFATEAEAAAHAEAVAGDWPEDTVAYAHYPLGWDGGGSRSTS